MAGGVMYL